MRRFHDDDCACFSKNNVTSNLLWERDICEGLERER